LGRGVGEGLREGGGSGHWVRLPLLSRLLHDGGEHCSS
jgi:hypothetical protein